MGSVAAARGMGGVGLRVRGKAAAKSVASSPVAAQAVGRVAVTTRAAAGAGAGGGGRGGGAAARAAPAAAPPPPPPPPRGEEAA
jgi:hypothetical protein